MCGINGILGVSDSSFGLEALRRMNYQMSHRGPDAEGEYVDNNILLGHRRLSIIDLDARGNQPMWSDCKRYVIVFNGEIYNFEKLRPLVSTYPYRSATDTEVILALFLKMGKQMLGLLEGMFAIAIWDKTEQKLFLARDRFGKKPLYYKLANISEGKGYGFIFSSEIRSIIQAGFERPKLNKKLLPQYLQYQTVFDPFTLVDGILQLEAGCYAEVELEKNEKVSFNQHYYYKREEQVSSNPYGLTNYIDVVKKTRELFDEAVSKRLVADVDFGAFLSGGIDSSAVVAVMSRHLQNPVKTFHIYFDDSEFSELKYAEIIAKKYQTDHNNILIRPTDFLAEVKPALSSIDHPSADGINTYVVSKYTRAAGIKMALSGLGGDEIFAGYDVFHRMSQIEKLRKIGIIQFWESLPYSLRVLPKVKGKLRELMLLDRIDVPSGYELFRQLFSGEELKKYHQYLDVNAGWSFKRRPKHWFAWIGNEEIERYMKPVLLRDTDQMSMAHSLEVRVPFLDHTLSDFVMSLPDHFKPTKPGKKLLIDALGDDLPREIWDRKKMGFVFPWKRWVNQELKSVVDEGLDVVAAIEGLEELVMELKLTQIGPENKSWYRVWLLSTLGHWIKNNNIDCN